MRPRAVAGLAVLALVVAGCGGSGGGSSPTVLSLPSPHHGKTAVPQHVTLEVASKKSLGRFLTAAGRTLYMYPPDRRRRVTCTTVERCEAAWPPLFVAATGTVTAGRGVRKSLIGTDPGDGGRVVTYHGWPLYFYIGDRKPGQANGQGQGDIWFVIAPNGRPIHS